MLKISGSRPSTIALILCAGGGAYAAAPKDVPRGLVQNLSGPTLGYRLGQRYAYAVDCTSTETFGATSAGSNTPGTASRTQATRVTGILYLTPLALNPADATHPAAYYVHKVSVPADQFTTFTGDGSDSWTPVTVDTSAITKDFVVEQTLDGHITAVRWSSPAADDGEQKARNTLKGLVGLLDFGLPALGTTPRAEVCTDVLGSYNATFTRSATDANQILMSKTNYVATAPGVALYNVDGESWTPVTGTQFAETGQHTITLASDGSNIPLKREIREQASLQSSTASLMDQDLATSLTRTQDGGSFAPTGSLTITGTMTMTGTQADSSLLDPASFTQRDTLQAILPSSHPFEDGEAFVRSEEMVAAGLSEARDPGSWLKAATHIARGLRGGAVVAPLGRILLDPKTDPSVAQTLAIALGGCRTAEVRDILRKGLVSPQVPVPVKAKLLEAVIGSATAEDPLVDAVEGLSAQPKNPLAGKARSVLATLVPAIQRRNPARAEGIVENLVTQLERAGGTRDKAAILCDLVNTHSEFARPVLQSYASGEAVLGSIAAQGLVASGHQTLGTGVGPSDFNNLLHDGAVQDQDGAYHDVALYTSTLKYCSHELPGVNTLISKSAGSKWLGGTVWAGYGVGANFGSNDAKAALVLAAGVQADILTVPLGLLGAQAYALYDAKDPKDSYVFWNYNVMGVTGAGSDNNDDQPDDFHYPAKSNSFRTAFYQYDTGPIPVLFFFVDFWAGVGLDSGVAGKHGGFSTTQPMFVQEAPYTSIAAWAGASAGWACLNVSLELEGQFLNTSIPVRLDTDGSHANSSGAPPAYCVDAGLQLVPWYMGLTASLHYCIGSKSELVWSDSAKPEYWALSTYCDPAADLAVTGLNWTPDVSPDTSKPLAITATIKNTSTIQTDPDPNRHILTNVYYDAQDANHLIGSFKVQSANGDVRPLAAGETFTGVVKWASPIAGNHTLIAVTDPDAGGQNQSGSGIPDGNMANNTLSKPVTILPVLPDLVVASAQPAPPAGSQASLALSFGNLGPGHNPGTMNAGPLHPWDTDPPEPRWVPTPVAFAVTTTDGKTTLAQGSFYYPEAGNSTPVSVSFPMPANHLVNVRVNPAGSLQEKTTTNDTMVNVDVSTTDYAAPSVGLTLLPVTTLADWEQENQTWIASITEPSDVRIDRVEWYLDGNLVNLARATPTTPFAPGSLSLTYRLNVANSPVQTLAEGTHTFQVKAFNQAGAMGTASVSFTLRHPDLVPPEVACANPLDLRSPFTAASPDSAGIYTFTSTASDDKDGVDHVDYYLDGENTYLGAKLSASAAPYTVKIPNDDRLPFGFHNLYAVAFDKANLEIPGVSRSNPRVSPVITFQKGDLFTEVEPNDTLATANPIYPYTRTISGQSLLVSNVANPDYFKIPCYPGQTLTLGSSSHVLIYDASGNQVGDNWPGGDGSVGFDGTTTHPGPLAFYSWTNNTTSPFVYVLAKGYYRWKPNPFKVDQPPTYSAIWWPIYRFDVSRTPELTVTVAPGSASVAVNATCSFTANLSEGASSGVTWSVSPSKGATISSAGAFQATAAGTYTVIAKSKADYTKVGTATVTVH